MKKIKVFINKFLHRDYEFRIKKYTNTLNKVINDLLNTNTELKKDMSNYNLEIKNIQKKIDTLQTMYNSNEALINRITKIPDVE